MCGRICAAGIPSTRGRKTRRPPSPNGDSGREYCHPDERSDTVIPRSEATRDLDAGETMHLGPDPSLRETV